MAPRLLFSADAAGQVLDATLIDPLQQAAISQPAIPVATAQQQQQSRELVVIDSRLADVEHLIDDLRQQREEGRTLDWILVDAQTDGLARLSEQLDQARAAPYTAVHVLTHGDADGFELGAQRIDAGTLRLQAAQIAQWSGGLSADADLLIYGCDLASSDQGRDLLGNLAMLTGADVAASDDITGAGGDWALEFQHGTRESEIAVSGDFALAWQGQLTIDAAGAETLVNDPAGDQTPDAESSRQVATNGSQTVVVWEEGDNVYFRIYGANASGSEVLVVNNDKPFTSGAERMGARDQPSVAMAANGDFIVVWSAQNGYFNNQNIYAQRFFADGSPMARPSYFNGLVSVNAANNRELAINADSGTWSEDQYDPAVALRDDGHFLISWTDEVDGDSSTARIRYRLFGADGNPIDPVEKTAMADAAGVRQDRSTVAWNRATNEFVVGFLRKGGGQVTSVFLPLTDQGDLDPTSPGPQEMTLGNGSIEQYDLDIAYQGNGRIAWVTKIKDGSDEHILLSAKDFADVVTPTTAVIVNADPSAKADKVSIALGEDDSLLVAWQEETDTDGSLTVMARQYDADRHPLGPAWRVPQSVTGVQENVSVASANGQASVVWLNDGNQAGHADNNGVFLRTVALSVPRIVVVGRSGTQLSEDGSVTQTVDVVLSSAPASTVTVVASSSDNAEAGFSPGSMNFTGLNWSTPQSLTVFGRDDAFLDGNKPVDITLSTTSSDPAWDGLTPVMVDFVTVDDEVGNQPVGALSDADGSANEVSEAAAAGTPIGVTALASDPDVGEPVSYSVVSPGSPFDVDPVSGVVTRKAGGELDREASSSASLTIRATSTDGSFSEQAFTVAILDSNDNRPVISPATFSIAENPAVAAPIGTITATDPDLTGTLSNWTLVGGSTIFSLDANTGALSVLDPAAFDREVSSFLDVQVTVSDGVNTSNPATVRVDIINVNEAPVMSTLGGGSPLSVSHPENQADVLLVTATDVDSASVTFAITGGPDQARFSLDPNSGQLRFVQAPDFENPVDADMDNRYQVEVAATDGTATSPPQAIEVQVIDAAETLVINRPASLTGLEDTPLNLAGSHAVSVSDPLSAGNLTLTLGVSHGTLSLAGGPVGTLQFSAGDGTADRLMTFSGGQATVNQALAGLQYLPDRDFAGGEILQILVVDTANPARQQSDALSITLAPVNDPPVLSGSRWILAEPNQATSIGSDVLQALDVDDAASALVYRLETAPTSGALLLDGVALASGGSFSQADIDRSGLMYQPDQTDPQTTVILLSITDAAGNTIGGIELRVESLSGVATPPDSPQGGAQASPSKDQQESADERDQDDQMIQPVINPSPSGDAAIAPPANGAARAEPSTGAAPAMPAVRAPSGANPYASQQAIRQLSPGGSYQPISGGLSEIRSMAPDGTPFEGARSDYLRVRLDGYNKEGLERASAQLREFSRSGQTFDRQVVASTVAVSTGVSIGYVIWLIRGGALLSSLLASLPAWRSIDPLPVLNSLNDQARNDADEESLESMLKQAKQPPGGPEALPEPVPESVAAMDGHAAGRPEGMS